MNRLSISPLTTVLRFACLLLCLLHTTTTDTLFARCREQPISCFDCDSRIHPNCADPFHPFAVLTKNCQGCCTKATFSYPEYYVVRTCANFGDTRIFDFDLTCENINGREKRCYCNDNLCNTGYSLKVELWSLLTAVLSAICFNNGIMQYLC